MKSKLHVFLFIFCFGAFQHADAQLFKRLKKKAKEIVDYREKNGEFSSVDSLVNVKGIGEATVEKNRERIQL